MNTTDHYQLNQWEGTDRILRTDFNADNLKTDDAAAELRADVDALTPKAGAQLLKSGTLSESCSSYRLSLTGINWAAWKAVHFSLDPKTDSGNAAISIHDPWGDPMGAVSGNYGSARRSIGHIIWYPLFNPERPVSSISLGYGRGEIYVSELSFQDLTFVDLICNSDYQMVAGTSYQIWGEK